MKEAVALARHGRWAAAPNPCVGALLVKDGQIVARGWHTAYGKPHAEVECLRDADRNGVNPAECTLVVTLEPCNHTGKTPPCSHAVLKAGIKHVVIGMMDPNPVAQGGAQYLRDHGVLVEAGVCEQDCNDVIADFITWKKTPLPYTIIKLASTLDGRIATRTGHSRWISGEKSRTRVHELRSHAGAVIVGGNTFRKDNPQLTCRLSGVRGQPLAVVVTSELPEADSSMYLLRERAAETIFWTPKPVAESAKADVLRNMGVRVKGLDRNCKGRLDLRTGLAALRNEEDCYYTLCEGGGMLALSLLEMQLAQELELHMAPKLLGDAQAAPLFDGRTPSTMDQALGLRICDVTRSGEDVIMTLRTRN
ncbi:bifunctional diaminohydroxyphosphoribosylaminopyrimidine deaminase/5-amino-6-(5-phosphoribosylamino)uracil reductase RibD [Oleidesulfovibrio sp.]|uniref:bifunctional diaminohydroxyphosphoribosylaminopyrimidine deaminase/5-amino-6-(5-phosphoribosylamino)uracil reductase RibD n=1 Tax=Oleidesulfovibrio sp. TaxID=2909707 RepID=UPI003A84CBB6